MRHEKLEWTLEVNPELYGQIEGMRNAYMVRKIEYGAFSKKDAEIICRFLRNNFLRILNDYEK